METRKIFSVIGNISTGKSSFLNYLLGSDILETGDGLKTRFIVIIRHTENNDPVLSHIIRKTNAYDDLYIKKEDEQGKIEYKGKKEITEKINSLNKILKKLEDEGELDYSKHLYLLETRIKNIRNKVFLNSFDLADIPGLNNMSKNEGVFGSIKAIFTPLKRLIKYGFLIFDVSQYDDDSIEVVRQLIFELKIKINHFLIILNKIDRKPIAKREEAFLMFKAKLNYYLGDDLLNDTNSIVTMSSLELLEEENVMLNFNNFLNYYFKRFNNDTYEKEFKKLISYGYYMNNKLGPRKKYSDIEKILKPDTELDEDYIEYLMKIAEKTGLKLSFDPDEENYENICKLFNLLKKAFLKKETYFYIEPSEYRKKIDEFINRKEFILLNNETKENQNKNLIEEPNEIKLVNEQLLNCMDKLKSFYKDNIKNLQSIDDEFEIIEFPNNKEINEECDNIQNSQKNIESLKDDEVNKKNINIESLGERMQNLEKLIACHDKIRITVYGTYNAGKSSILNSFIGKDLLQVDDEQCTGKPVLIRYLKKDEKPKIYRAELKTVKDSDKFSHYAFIEKGQALAEGDEAVKNFISSQNIIVNNNFDNNQNKIEDIFILKTPIRFLDELDLSEEIKNNVEFLDTPGLTSQYLENKSELLEKLIEQTFIYFFIIDPKIGGADTNSFKQILTNTVLKTINNRSIINDSITFPYLFICNKCDDEKTDFNSEKCNQNINSILATEKENFDIIKFSSHKRKKILDKMKEYIPENFIEKVEKEFFNVLYYNSKTFYDYLDSYIAKDFKNNFIGELNPELKPDQIILDKIIKILIKKDYQISEENKIILSKLSGYLSFCNNNFDNLKIADNIMMDEIKNKIKNKIIIAYDHIKNGYKNQVLTALNFIENFIKIGVIPDSSMNRTREKEIKRAEKILSDIKKLLETNNVPKVIKNFRQEITQELENNYGIKEDYSNYEEIIKNKQNFISEKFKKINEQLLPEMFSNIQKGISQIIEDAFKDFCEENNIEIYYENGKLIAKIKPSMIDTTLKTSGSFLITAAGIGIANYAAGSVVIEEIIRNGIFLYYSPYFVKIPFFGGKIAAKAAAKFGALMTHIGWLALLVGGIAVTVGGIKLTIDNFGERKKNYYNQLIKNLKEKFFSFYNGYENKILEQYNAIKEKSAENVASYLNMQYFPVQLDEDQRQNLLNKFEDLQKEINNILSLN